MSHEDETAALAAAVIHAAAARGVMVATAESCTGGLVGGALTEIAGSSAAYDRGFITYSNESKHEALGVETDLIAAHGAVSGPVAAAMAEGALARSRARLSVSVTGVAGPDGGTAKKPVGLVWFARATQGGETVIVEERFTPKSAPALQRGEIRRAAVMRALELLRDGLGPAGQGPATGSSAKRT